MGVSNKGHHDIKQYYVMHHFIKGKFSYIVNITEVSSNQKNLRVES